MLPGFCEAVNWALVAGSAVQDLGLQANFGQVEGVFQYLGRHPRRLHCRIRNCLRMTCERKDEQSQRRGPL